MNNTLYQRSLISIQNLSHDEIVFLLELALAYKKGTIVEKTLSDKIMASCFFEPSTRTRLSFESAMLRLGGQFIGFSDPANNSSQRKGESLSDSLKIIGGYADVMVIRHPQEGAAQLASDIAGIPVINAGDGANQHPTQTLIDLFSMRETHGELQGLKVAIAGDLRYGRTAHSLVQAASLFNMRLYFVSPPELNLPENLSFDLKRRGITFSFHQHINDVIDKVDILYLTRLQKERLALSVSAENYAASTALSPEILSKALPKLKILHPLPRQEELPISIDSLPQAYYFEQAKNGVFVRQALLHAIFNS